LKKAFLFFLLAVLIFCNAGCDKSEPSDKPIEENSVPEITLVINDSKKNTENDIQIFGNRSERERFAYLHYFVEGEAPEYDLRIRTEICRGKDDYNVGEDFETLSDETVTEKSGKWHREEIFLASADIYFYRVTIYQEESENILASKTFYTPKEERVYSEVLQNVPEYRPIELTKEERDFYGLCSFAVFDFAKANEYSDIHDIKGYFSSDGTKLYLTVVFRAPWSVFFEINVKDPTNYSVSYEPFNFEGLEKALLDYDYVIEEFKKNF
jgi:hypothetical protein